MTQWGSAGMGDSQFGAQDVQSFSWLPFGFAVDNQGNITVSDPELNRITKFAPR
jgi:hypothetical protein